MQFQIFQNISNIKSCLKKIIVECFFTVGSGVWWELGPWCHYQYTNGGTIDQWVPIGPAIRLIREAVDTISSHSIELHHKLCRRFLKLLADVRWLPVPDWLFLRSVSGDLPDLPHWVHPSKIPTDGPSCALVVSRCRCVRTLVMVTSWLEIFTNGYRGLWVTFLGLLDVRKIVQLVYPKHFTSARGFTLI